MTRSFVIGVVPGIDACSGEVQHHQTVTIFLVLVFCPNVYQAAHFLLAKTQFLSTNRSDAAELRVLRRETQKLKPVISDSHYFLSHFPYRSRDDPTVW